MEKLTEQDIEYYHKVKRDFDVDDRIKYIDSFGTNKELYEYLKERLLNTLTIQVKNNPKENIFILMKYDVLRGWCYQTSVSTILFLEDNAYISRSYIHYQNGKSCYHSWIKINYNNEEYIFDPCLRLLALKDIYFLVFEVEDPIYICAKEIQNEFLNQIKNPDLFKYFPNKRQEQNFINFMNLLVSGRNKDEIQIIGNKDPYEPMYQNNTGYIAEYDNDGIKKVFAHFY